MPLQLPPLSRVELHVHLDGALRPSTIWELCKKKGLPLPGSGTLSDLTSAIQPTVAGTLTSVLAVFSHTAPSITGDVLAIERIAVEFCEDAAKTGLLYVEAR